MTTPYSPDGTYPTFPLDLVDDGEVYNFDSIMKSGNAAKGLIANLINGIGYLGDPSTGILAKLASQVTSSSGVRLVGAEAHTGANGQGNYSAQTLFALLGSIWDNKGGLGTANTWTSANTWTGALTRSGTGNTLAERVSAYNAALTTATIGAMADFHFVANPTHVGDTVYTLQSTGTIPPTDVTTCVTAVNMVIGHNLDIQREDASSIIKFSGAGNGWADFGFISPAGGGSPTWRLLRFGGDATITIGTP